MRKRNGLNVCYRFKCNAIGTIVIGTKYSVRTIGILISGICHGVVIWSRLLLSEHSMLMQSTEFSSIVMFALRQLQHGPRRLILDWSRQNAKLSFLLFLFENNKRFLCFFIFGNCFLPFSHERLVCSVQGKVIDFDAYSVRWGLEGLSKSTKILFYSLEYYIVRFWYTDSVQTFYEEIMIN